MGEGSLVDASVTEVDQRFSLNVPSWDIFSGGLQSKLRSVLCMEESSLLRRINNQVGESLLVLSCTSFAGATSGIDVHVG